MADPKDSVTHRSMYDTDRTKEFKRAAKHLDISIDALLGKFIADFPEEDTVKVCGNILAMNLMQYRRHVPESMSIK